VDRFYLLTPPLLLLATLVIAFVVYCGLRWTGRAPEPGEVKHNLVFNRFMAEFLAWLLGPIERALVGRVSPNLITALSLAMCAATGIAVGTGHLPAAVWLFAFAGIFDVLDGRIARLSNHETAAGALFDSVSDRWGELLAFSGYIWYLHDSAWLLAVMAALCGSMMVSYTRARAEGLGISLSGGVMQRAERMVLVAAGTLVAAWFGSDPELVAPILGITMLACGVASTATAINRWIVAYRALTKPAQPQERDAIGVVEVQSPAPAPRRFPGRAARRVHPLEQH
jgi:CDP-diacylglycerol--glycerol-3-phosphate 3-phosphatidyltransferase